MEQKNKKLTDKQVELRTRLIMFVIGVVVFATGILLGVLAKDNISTWPEWLFTIVEFVAWPFRFGGFILILLGLGAKTSREKKDSR